MLNVRMLNDEFCQIQHYTFSIEHSAKRSVAHFRAGGVFAL